MVISNCAAMSMKLCNSKCYKEKYSSNNTEDRSKFQEAGVTEVCQEAISVILVFDKVSTRAVAVKLERKARISKGIL